MATIQKIQPCLWFDGNGEEAARFYTSVFKNAGIGKIVHYSKEAAQAQGVKEGAVLTVEFELENQKFLALNGGPHFKFNEAVSLMVNCKDQNEIDYYWEKLTAGGDPKAQQCGWLKDKFRLSWQVVPEAWADMMYSKDTEASSRAMNAMMKMKKLDIAELQKAFKG